MSNYQKIAIVIAVVGAILLLASLLADVSGASTDPDEFGSRQVLGTVVGIVILAVGGAVYFYGDRFMGTESDDQEDDSQ